MKQFGKLKTIHGHCSRGNTDPVYSSWSRMKSRCYNKASSDYEYYGGRGIKVCKRWRESFENFLADMGNRPAGLTLERSDNKGDYCPDNCYWATRKEQSLNKSSSRMLTFNGETLNISLWAERLNIKDSTLRRRIARGWTAERAIVQDVRKVQCQSR